MNQFAENGVFLRRTPDDREWPNCAVTVVDFFNFQNGKVMLQAVVSKMIAKRAFGQQAFGVDGSDQAKISL